MIARRRNVSDDSVTSKCRWNVAQGVARIVCRPASSSRRCPAEVTLNRYLLAGALACAALLAGCGLDVMYADWKVDRLCKNDGGVKVFITDKPPEEFKRQDGNLDLEALQRATPEQSFYLKRADTRIEPGEPSIVRSVLHVYRHRDHALMGTSVVYIRPALNTGVPLMSRKGYSCPDPADLGRLVEAVFYSRQRSR